MHIKEYTPATFLNIEAVFNNIYPDALVSALSSLKLGQNLIRFIDLLLKSRIVTSTMSENRLRKAMFYPQFSGTFTLGIMAERIYIHNWPLQPVRIIGQVNGKGHSNDIGIGASGISPQMLFNTTNFALSVVLNWCRDC